MKRINVRSLCECALLVALEVILNRFVSFQMVGLKFGLSFLPMALSGMMFGPWAAAVCYALGDLIGSLLFPMGPYFPGFTLTCALMGAVYGFIFQNKDKLRFWPEIIVSAIVNCGILGLCLNSFWMSVLYSSKGFTGWLVYRLPQEAGLFILHLLLLPLISTILKRIQKGKQII